MPLLVASWLQQGVRGDARIGWVSAGPDRRDGLPVATSRDRVEDRHHRRRDLLLQARDVFGCGAVEEPGDERAGLSLVRLADRGPCLLQPGRLHDTGRPRLELRLLVGEVLLEDLAELADGGPGL